MSEITKELPITYQTPTMAPFCKDEEKYKVVDDMVNKVQQLKKEGVKIDNLVQIAHNVEVGENTVIAAQTGVSGSSKIDENVMIGGQVGIAGHLKISKGTKIAAQSGITKSVLKENSILQGTPAFSSNDFKRSYVLFKNFPELKKQIEFECGQKHSWLIYT